MCTCTLKRAHIRDHMQIKGALDEQARALRDTCKYILMAHVHTYTIIYLQIKGAPDGQARALVARKIHEFAGYEHPNIISYL